MRAAGRMGLNAYPMLPDWITTIRAEKPIIRGDNKRDTKEYQAQVMLRGPDATSSDKK